MLSVKKIYNSLITVIDMDKKKFHIPGHIPTVVHLFTKQEKHMRKIVNTFLDSLDETSKNMFY